MVKNKEKLMDMLAEQFGDDPESFRAVYAAIKKWVKQAVLASDGRSENRTTELKDWTRGKLDDLSGKMKLIPGNLKTYVDGQIEKVRDSAVQIAREVVSAAAEDIEELSKKIEGYSSVFEAINTRIDKLQNRIDKLGRNGSGGPTMASGAPNRSVYVNGKIVSGRFSDVNFKAGSNVTITTADNMTTMQVDVTVTSSGGGSGPTVPTGTVDGSNNTFTASTTPTIVFTEGGHFTNGFGVTITGLSIVFDLGLQPQKWIYYI